MNVTHANPNLEQINYTAEEFSQQDDSVSVNGVVRVPIKQDDVETGCVVSITDTYTMTAGDTSRRLDNNDTMTVVWEHTQTDTSDTQGFCGTDNFFPRVLPCDATITFDLTKVSERSGGISDDGISLLEELFQ